MGFSPLPSPLGSTIPTRYVGGTTGGPPTIGTYAVGDFVVATTGGIWVCIAGGSPGTWARPDMANRADKIAETQTVTSSTVLVNDDTLLVPVVAAATYYFEAVVFYESGTAGDFKIAFTCPANSTLKWGQSGATASVSAASSQGGSGGVVAASGTAGASLGGLGAGVSLMVLVRGKLTTTDTAGNLQLQWAQASSDGTAAKVNIGSHLVARRVA